MGLETLMLIFMVVALAGLALAGYRGFRDRAVLQEKLRELILERDGLQESRLLLRQDLDRQLRQNEAHIGTIKTLEQDKYRLAVEKTRLESQLEHLNEKLNFQEKELEKMGVRFRQEFELLANKILEEKSLKFTRQNQENMSRVLDPLEKDLAAFRKQVQETYSLEARERFSLEKKVKELANLNQQISEEARNLTNALKGNAKFRGNWGEAILETILQHSGLERGRHYSIQEFLKDDSGQPLLGQDGKKMQPDVIIHYPDDKKVIIDAKVSLMAYEKYSSSTDTEIRKNALNTHLKAIKTHIDQLSAKQYEAYAKALDFVIMFVPLEAAYIAALQEDGNIWEYAYKKRVLLISSSNLIAALKMIKDLWIRDDQSRNAAEIADRGGRMYDKFASFLGNLEDIGRHMEKSRESYQTAIKQLKTGRGNLLSQAEKLRALGINARQKISDSGKN
ncbi:DNA recombination protein RmuC [Cyclobacterium lianum]|uniref:DNA recombination protein RmuC n=1 Tax=Cyclobacterium lianum TaxID=388280 RepID=A0A1M7PDD2_9BACT|nr:DNA recombination protein RmuC [Cyclobacterium lianum]SHN14909.1 DNA recombination protein RmuC [Cyclobacterium lianum]